jgi:hypothetical protein
MLGSIFLGKTKLAVIVVPDITQLPLLSDHNANVIRRRNLETEQPHLMIGRLSAERKDPLVIEIHDDFEQSEVLNELDAIACVVFFVREVVDLKAILSSHNGAGIGLPEGSEGSEKAGGAVLERLWFDC